MLQIKDIWAVILRLFQHQMANLPLDKILIKNSVPLQHTEVNIEFYKTDDKTNSWSLISKNMNLAQ